MTAHAPNSIAGAFKTLWRRAPLWRFALLTALICTLLFVLYPPTADQNPENQDRHLPTNQATYANPGLPGRHTPPPSRTVTANEVPSLPRAQKQLPSEKILSPSRPVTADTKTVDLSLAPTPGLNGSRTGNSRVFNGSLTLDNFVLPLPEGNWTMLANTSIHTQTASGMAYYLGRIEHKRLVGALKVFAIISKDTPGAGFEAIPGCQKDNPNLNYLVVESNTPHDHEACWFIDNVYTPPFLQWADRAAKLNNLDRAFAGAMAAEGVTYPQDLVRVRFSRAEKWGLLEAGYMFSPDAEGISSNTVKSYQESDWHKANIAHYPEKLAYIKKLKDWGNTFWNRFQKAFADGEKDAVAR